MNCGPSDHALVVGEERVLGHLLTSALRHADRVLGDSFDEHRGDMLCGDGLRVSLCEVDDDTMLTGSSEVPCG
jgi:hypothetical protein